MDRKPLSFDKSQVHLDEPLLTFKKNHQESNSLTRFKRLLNAENDESTNRELQKTSLSELSVNLKSKKKVKMLPTQVHGDE